MLTFANLWEFLHNEQYRNFVLLEIIHDER